VVAPSNTKQLLAKLDRITELLRSPGVPAQMHDAEGVAVSISQSAPSGVIAELALRLVAVLGATARFPDMPAYMVTLDLSLRQLREALLAMDHNKSE
jgi:hypothetical protein